MNDITIPMTLGVEYDINKETVFTGPFIEVLTGTLETLDDTMIPETITELRPYIFQGNPNLTDVSLTHVTEVGSNTFASCDISNLYIPHLAVAGSQAFSYNPIVFAEFPELTYVSSGMFQRCIGLISADFATATSIRRQAFYGCEILDTLILRSNTVVELEDIMTFTDTKIASGDGYIYVPDELVSSYQLDTSWSTYAQQIRPISELEV